MQSQAHSPPPKPISQIWRPELTRLPRLDRRRGLFRGFVRILSRLLIRVLTDSEVHGLEHLPPGPALLVTNHLGDADTPMLLAALPIAPEVLGKIELLSEFPMLGHLMDWYGTIWVHRGRVDRRALDCAVQALREGRSLVVAPEGRYTLTGGLERGTGGASYIALRARTPIVPLALTGTQNNRVYPSLRRLRRPRLTLTVGVAFELQARSHEARDLEAATQQIMESIAALLPPEYRGAYKEAAK
jgi:1-acyl-sn-glycerol-3-phosphate acyltransferase